MQQRNRASRRRDEHGCSISEMMNMLRNMNEIERGVSFLCLQEYYF